MNPALDTLEGRVQRIAGIIDEMKGEEIIFMDLRGISDFADGFVIATVRSSTHMQALTATLLEKLRDEGLRPVNKPELSSPRWTLIDYSNVVVHLFDAEARRFYDLESLWGDAQTYTMPSMAMA
jgi:ribosome-associated protein